MSRGVQDAERYRALVAPAMKFQLHFSGSRVHFAGPSRLSISNQDRLQTRCTGASLELSMLASSAEGHTSLKVVALVESIRGHSNKHLKES